MHCSGKRISVQAKLSAFGEKNQRSGEIISAQTKESAFRQKNQRS
ncbi:hypothetical protein SAMN02982927_01963, partial [Sporolactobacillus nakayamae]